jgi:hypothetical protein
MSKTHFKKMKNPEYIGSWDLMDDNGQVQNRIVTVKNVKKTMVHDGQGGQEECPIVEFNECKPMVTNSTNLKTLAKITGSVFIEDWIGKRIELTVKRIRAFGEFHDAIRVVDKLPEQTTKKQPPILALNKVDAVRTAISDGKYTIEQIKTMYTITPEVMEALTRE